MSAVQVISFGYGHAPAPEARMVIDLRPFRDPHVTAALRELTAADQEVTEAVWATPGIPDLVQAVVAAVEAYLEAPEPGTVTVATGCTGGRHRGPAVAEMIAAHLEFIGIPTTVSHRDMHRPVLTPARRA